MKKGFILLLCTALMLAAFAAPAWAAKSDDATIAEIVVDGQTLTVRNSMEATLPLYADQVEINLTLSDSNADYALTAPNGCTWNDNQETLTLDTYQVKDAEYKKDAAYTVTIQVQAEDGKTEKTYTLKLTRSFSPLLDGLAVNSSADGAAKGNVFLADKDFSANQYTYNLTIPASQDTGTAYLWLEPLHSEDLVYVKVGGGSSNRVSGSQLLGCPVTLTATVTNVLITVVRSDSYAEYALTVTREDGSQGHDVLKQLIAAADDDADEAYTLYPAFDKDTDTYYVFLPKGITQVFFYAEAIKDEYIVSYSTAPATEDYNEEWYFFTGIVQQQQVDITVKDKGGALLGIYSVLFRLGNTAGSADCDLDGLTISQQTAATTWTPVKLNETVKAKVYQYTCDLTTSGYNKLRINAEAFHSGAYVLINGQLQKDDYLEFPLSSGANVFTVNIIAQNCDNNASYTLTVYNGGGSAAGSLSKLSAKGYGSDAISLSPDFSSQRLSYTGNVANSVQYVSFYLEGASAATKLSLRGYAQESGKQTNYYALSEGINTFAIQAYTGTDSSKGLTYTVTIYRQPATLKAQISSQKLTVDGKELTLNAYNINGNNFVKLRDMAALLSGTAKQFQVAYNESLKTVELTSGQAYTSIGQENIALAAPSRAQASIQAVYLDKAKVTPMAYNINDNNYLLLRDVGLLLDFEVDYLTASQTVVILTNQAYDPD